MQFLVDIPYLHMQLAMEVSTARKYNSTFPTNSLPTLSLSLSLSLSFS